MSDTQIERLLRVLFEIGKAIGSDIDRDLLFARISELVCVLVGADACSIMLLDASGNTLVARAAHGLPPSQLHEITFRMGEGVAGWVVAHGEAALIPDASADPRFIQLSTSNEPIGSMACVPLLARGARVGAMTVTSATRDVFSRSDVELLGFVAKTIALDVENLRLRRLTVTDALTGTYNREFLQRQLPTEIERACQLGRPLSIAMVDVDHFKLFNDRFGHEVGDQVLTQVALRLRGAIRTSDFLIRYGGEEFLVVLPNASRERAWEIGERMRMSVASQGIPADGQPMTVHVSVGLAEHRMTEGTPEDATALIRRADRALYAAKRRGRNRVEVAP